MHFSRGDLRNGLTTVLGLPKNKYYCRDLENAHTEFFHFNCEKNVIAATGVIQSELGDFKDQKINAIARYILIPSTTSSSLIPLEAFTKTIVCLSNLGFKCSINAVLSVKEKHLFLSNFSFAPTAICFPNSPYV